MKIAIGNDHAAIQLKQEIIDHLKSKDGIEISDFGATDNQNLDYPEYAWRVSKAVVDQICDIGILLCGTGVGMSIAANKVRGIRAVVCSDTYSAQLSRTHNDANILCLGARVVGSELAKAIVHTFLEAKFEGGRHQTRVEQITAMERR